jgi:hypothetical protein
MSALYHPTRTGDEDAEELCVLHLKRRAHKMTELMIDEVLEIAETFQIAARQLRRLGSGPLKNGLDRLSSREIYQFNGRVRLAHSFPHDVCFETANKLEELAAKLELLVRPEPLQS